ncbi:MAG TPA: CADD family putative folate metabolism protein [Actinomycetota bacterium]|nr:CADD family putative folate metabolism protein [Actinomycetota bacterium]
MDVLAHIDRLIAERHLLTHPFYEKWQSGTLPKGALQDYARQYYAFESAFPTILSAIHSRTEDPVTRQHLLENLWDEEHGPQNHAELWLRFAEGVGVSRESVRGAAPTAQTRDLVATYRRSATTAPVPAAVAGVYAYESQVPAVAEKKIAGLREHFGVDDPSALSFFTVHQALDVEHAGAERTLIERLAAGHEEEVIAATSDALEAWWGFLDGVDPEGC